MRATIPLALCAGLALASLAGGQRAPQDDQSLEERVTALEDALAERDAMVDAMAVELAETRELVQGTVQYLRAQAEAAKQMSGTIDRAVAQGYTQGINWESRELLVAGWKAEIAARQAGLPGPEPKQPDEEKRGARR